MSPFLILVIVALFLSGAYLFLRNWTKQKLKKLHDESKASLKKITKKYRLYFGPYTILWSLVKHPPVKMSNGWPLIPEPGTNCIKHLRSTRSKPFARYAKSEALAESQLVSKIQHIHALGKVPNEIEFEEKVSFNRGGKDLDYYVFRLKPDRTHRFADKGWVRAIGGP